MDEPRITSYAVALEDQATYYATHFGELAPVMESSLHTWMKGLCPLYSGCTWTAHELSNGGFYMRPAQEERFHLDSPNGFSHEVSADAAGIVVSMFAINRAANATERGYLVDSYHALRHFAAEHAEGSKILDLTD